VTTYTICDHCQKQLLLNVHPWKTRKWILSTSRNKKTR